jgi:hypothetical protein
MTLAQQILPQRGRDVSADAVRRLRQNCLATLAWPEESQKTWILAGYLSALMGGLLGLLIGWHLASHKKQLPDGRQVLAFSATNRTHGGPTLVLSCLSIIGWALLRWYLA